MNEPGGLAYLVAKLQAMAWLVVGRTDSALAVFDRMQRQWPRDAYVLASRAHLHAQAGRRTLAIADARALVTAHPKLAAYHWFNLAFLLEADDRPAEAEPAFRHAVELDPKLDRAWYGLGLTLARLGRADEAVAALKRNTELQPMSPYGWTQLVRLHIKRAEPDEARKIIRHLKGFEPQVAAQLERETGLAP
jgi:tetratricopeptide (TPR) repeat protein